MELLILSTFIERTDRAWSAREVKLKGSDFIECFWVKKFASSISAACQQHGKVLSNWNREYFLSVDISRINNWTLSHIILNQSASICAIIYCLIQLSPFHIINIMIFWSIYSLKMFRGSFWLFSELQRIFKSENSNLTFFGSIFINNSKILITVWKLNLFDDDTRDSNLSNLISVWSIKDLNTLCSCCGKQIFRVLGDINWLAWIINLEKTNSFH